MQEVDVEGRHINLDSTRFFIRPYVEVTCVSKLKSETILSNSEYVNESLTFHLLFRWTKGDERPPSGSLVKLVTEDSQTRLELL